MNESPDSWLLDIFLAGGVKEFGLPAANTMGQGKNDPAESEVTAMSFCCGASMIGTRGTMKHFRTFIHNVPILFCPVCHRVEIHHLVEQEYELLAEYAHGDGASEVDFRDYVDQDREELLANCVNHEDEDPMEIVLNQIDMALDLLAVAKQLGDPEWEEQLKRRLTALNNRRNKLLQRRTSGRRT